MMNGRQLITQSTHHLWMFVKELLGLLAMGSLDGQVTQTAFFDGLTQAAQQPDQIAARSTEYDNIVQQENGFIGSFLNLAGIEPAHQVSDQSVLVKNSEAKVFLRSQVVQG